MVGPVTNEDLSISPNTDNIQQQQHYRLQLLAQAIEKVENESLQNTLAVSSSPITSKKQQQQSIPIDSLSMPSSQQQQQELLIKLLTQQNVAAVMAAAAAAQLQVQQQQQQQQQKIEPISPPSTSSASSTSESPIDFSSHRSIDDNNDCSTPSSPLPNQQQLLSTMLQNLQSTSPTSSFPFLLTNKNGKPTRPFKAYPREPLMLPLGFCPTTATEQTNILAEAASRTTSNRKRLAQTQERLKQRLQQQQQQQQQSYFISSSGTQILQPPKKRHRTMETTSTSEDNTTTTTTTTTENNNNNSSTNNDDPNNTIKDDAYWERRRKNNEAAKRSRDARRAKEDEIAIRAAILEQENIKLRLEVSQLKQETAKLRCMIPSIAFRLDISADIADHMEQNEENINKNQQELFLKYFIEAIQKQQQQQQVGSIDFSTRINQYNKLIRPFSSYSLTDNHLNSNENILQQFYKHLLKNVNQQDQYVSSISTNSISIKKDYKSNTSLPSPKNQDDVYWERRKKNNEAAKRSRDARRAKEDEIALRAAWLEQENVKLRLENAHLKQENIQLRCQIYRSNKS
ncbi:unnamed protein product [Rotaria sp. Silwood1]|nr:unnamed protein product [Rotaria sp. Silwood1]CAF1006437.1 unnamed protein product [Rotaria sp. Silwood1]